MKPCLPPQTSWLEDLLQSWADQRLYIAGRPPSDLPCVQKVTAAAAEVIMDRVKRLRGQGPPAAEMLACLVDKVTQLRFEHAAADTNVILPFAF